MFFNKEVRIKIKYSILSFVLTYIIFTICLYFLDIAGNDDLTILRGDLHQQYIPFIYSFFNSLNGDGSFWYSFSNYVGAGNILNYAYYALSPFNFLFLLAPESIEFITIIIITFKISLSSLTFYLFISNLLKKNDIFLLAASLFYGLNGFSVILHFNIMWLDAIYILPILILLVKRYVDENKYLLMIVSYVYLFLTNFYMGYMVGIFSAIFYILYITYNKRITDGVERKIVIKKSLGFAACVILAVGLCAFLLLSCAGFLLCHMASDNFPFDDLKATLFDIINSLYIGENPSLNNKVPFLYCGIPFYILTIFFFFNKNIDRALKYRFLFGIVFYIISMIYMPLYKFMHAFDYPNFYGYRFSFILIFIFITAGCISYNHEKIFNKTIAKVTAIVLIALYSFMISYQQIVFPNNLLNSQNGLLINAIFVVLWIYLLSFNRISKEKILNISIIVLSIAELFVNTYLCIDHIEFPSKTDDVINCWFYSEGDAINAIKAKEDENNFYRIYINNEWCSNAANMFSFNSLNTFSSSDNYNLRQALSNLGIAAPNRGMFSHSINPVFSSLFGVKYRLNYPICYAEQAENCDANNYPATEIEYVDNALSLGYMVNKDVLDYASEDNSFNNLENLCNLMTGMNESIFDDIEIDDDNIELYNVEGEKIDGSYVFKSKYSKVYGSKIYLNIDDCSSQPYIDFYQSVPMCYGIDDIILTEESGALHYLEPAAGGIYQMDRAEDNDYSLLMASGDPLAMDIIIYSLNAATCNTDNYQKIYDELSLNQFKILNNEGDRIDGIVEATEDKTILFTTIPYDPEWYVIVDGKKVQPIKTVDDAFLAVELEPGVHNVSFQYYEIFSNIGAIITLVSVLLFVLLLLLNIFKKNRNK